MFQFLSGSWSLLLGVMLLMVGNGLQGTLLGVRGEIEGFSTFEMSMVMSAYFVGFLGGSRMAPDMIRRVGHVRVFAALASCISAVLIMYPTFATPWVWILGRVLIGFCFSGVYVTAESWLNNAATNENRGQALSLYLVVQMIGIVAAQGILLTADPSGFVLFVIPSVLVSLSVTPILLAVSPTPAFESTQRMTLRDLVKSSPLGAVGIFLLGGVFSAQFGMSAVYGTQAGLKISEISIFVAAFYIGATFIQYPLGWLSDRMDRRLLVVIIASVAGIGALLGMVFGANFIMLLVAATIVGGMTNPLYSLLIAYTNDFLEHENMAAASAGLVFINGVGAIAGPLALGWIMEAFGPSGFWLFIAVLLFVLAAFAVYRMTQRAAPSGDDVSAYAAVAPGSSPLAVEAAREYAFESTHEDE